MKKQKIFGKPVFIISFVFLMLVCAQPGAAENTKLSDRGFQRLGLLLQHFFERFATAGIELGRGNFTASVGRPVFSSDNRRMHFSVTGMQKMSVEAVRHRITRFFYTETPLPPRKEYTGFFRVYPPETLDRIKAGSMVSLPFKLDIEINLQQCVFIAAKSGINFAINESKVFESDNLLIPFKRVQNEEYRKLLEKFFPTMCRLVLNRGIDQVLNNLLSTSTNRSDNVFKAIGIDDLISLGTFASIHGVKHIAAHQLKNLAAGAAGSALATLVIPIPVFGELALGAMLVSLAIKNSPEIISWSIAEFQRGIFRDRLGKATLHLMGKYPPGSHQIQWFDKQIAAEAAKDEFETLHKTLFFLRLQPAGVRKPWKSALKLFRVPVAAMSDRKTSFKAERYLTIIDFLLSE